MFRAEKEDAEKLLNKGLSLGDKNCSRRSRMVLVWPFDLDHIWSFDIEFIPKTLVSKYSPEVCLQEERNKSMFRNSCLALKQ
jgi:hypothetical protein